MAKRIKDEEMRFTINVNGDKAQKELFDLEKQTRNLTQENKTLRAEKQKLAAQGKKESAAYKNISAKIRENNAALKQKKSRMAELQKQIGVTGLTMHQLSQRASQLKLQLHNMVPGSAQYKKYQAELNKITNRMRELRGQAIASKFSMRGLADGFNRYAALGASVIATGTGIVLSVQQMIDYNGKLSDAQADVQKTTGLTKKEVDELTKSYGVFKSRTSRINLLALSEEAGRLGITGLKNIKDFTQTLDLLKVSLGDELSDEQIREVGKITAVYKTADKTGRDLAESTKSVASAINELGASGATNAPFLVDFAKRTGGLADVADIAETDMLGLAAAFDELGQSQEISATATNKTIISMGKNTSKFADLAGMSVGKFSKLLKEDANQALLAFLEGINKGNPSLEQLASKLDGVEVGGTRGLQAMLALAGNIDLVREKQQLANKALIENTSITDEYNIKNSTAGALLDKIKKKLAALFSSESILSGMTGFLEFFAKFIGATEDTDGSVANFKNNLIKFVKVVLIITTAVLSYKAAVQLATLWTNKATKATKLQNLVTKIHYGLLVAQKAGTIAYAGAQALLTGNIKRARAALVLFNRTLGISPLGLLVATLAAATAAWVAFSDEVTTAQKISKNLNDIRTSAAKSIAKEKVELNKLLRVAKDETLSKSKREKAIKKLNKISPEYLGNLNLETINTDKATLAVENYVKALNKKALATAAENKLVDLQKQKIELQEKTLDNYKSSLQSFGDDTIGKLFDKIFGETNELNIRNKEDLEEYLNNSYYSWDIKEQIRSQYDSLFAAKKAEVDEVEKQIESLNKYIETGVNSGDIEIDTTTTNNNDPVTPTSPTSNKSLENLKAEAEALARYRKENQQAEIELMQEGFKRELEQLEFNHKQKITQLKANLTSEKEIEQIRNKALNATSDKEAKHYEKLLQIRLAKNKEINQLIERSNQEHEQNKSQILEDGIQEYISKIKSRHEREEVLRETIQQRMLAMAQGNEAEVQRLKDKFREQNLQREKDNLLEIKGDFKRIIGNMSFKGFDLNILSEEEKQQIVNRLQELGLSIAEVNTLLAGMGKSGGDTEAPGNAMGFMTQGADILGFTPDQWSLMFQNFDTLEEKVGQIMMGFQAATNAFKMFSDFQSKKENARHQEFVDQQNREKDLLQRKLDAGIINQRQYENSIRALDRETEKKKDEIAKKQAEREKVMSLASIAMNTGQAIMSIWAQVPKFDFGISAGALTAFVASLGAAQAAMVMSTKGYEDGLYNEKIPVRREQDGKMFNAMYGGTSRSGIVDQPTMFLAGEQGKEAPEMIISGKDYAKMAPDFKEALSRQLGLIRGYENGLYKTSNNAMSSDKPLSSDSQDMAQLQMVLSRLSIALEDLTSNPVIAKMVADEENGRLMQTAIDKYKNIRENAKI